MVSFVTSHVEASLTARNRPWNQVRILCLTSSPHIRRSQSDNERPYSTFSPEGRLFQVEYSLEAIKLGSTAIGVRPTPTLPPSSRHFSHDFIPGYEISSEEEAQSTMIWNPFHADKGLGRNIGRSHPRRRETRDIHPTGGLVRGENCRN